jgi:hypothetical protein
MTTNGELSDKLDEVLKEVRQISKDNAARDEREKSLKDKVDKLELIVEGNGKEGLKTAVARLQDTMTSWSVKANIVAGLVGAQLVAIVFGMLTHTITFTP